MKNRSSSNKAWWGKSTAVLVIMVLLMVAMPITAAFALDTGFLSPTRAQTNGNGWKNITNSFVLDGKYTTAIKFNKTLRLSRFSIPTIPGGSTVTGIAVMVVGHTAGYQANVSLSYNNGANYLAPVATTLTASDTTITLGGPSSTWGRTWTPADFTNTNFVVRLALTGTKGTISVDQVQVKVYYSLPSTTLTLNPVAGSYGGTANMSATLTQTAGGAPITGATISFYLGGNGLDSGGNCTGTLAGSGTTSGGGVATFNGASLTGIAAGDYPNGACASYAGNGTQQATAITSDLNVNGVSSTLVVADATGAYGGTVNLSATLTINGAVPASPQNIDFYLFGNFEGTAPTNGSGVASLTGVSLAGFDAGTTQDVEAIFTSADPSVNPSDTFGQITITQLPLTVTAVTDSKVYDGTTSSTGTPLITGTILGGDTAQFFQTFDTKDPGTGKTILIGGAVDDGNSGFNYNVTPVSSTGTISKAMLTVTADNQIKVIGTSDPAFTYYYTGLQNSEDGSAIDTPPTCSVSVPHSALGTYPIICLGGVDNDYNFSYVSSSLSVDAEVQAFINGVLQGTYDLGVGTGTKQSYTSINNGPVKVQSSGHIHTVASTRVAYSPDGGTTWTSYSEMMGLPAGQLTDTYVFAWYNSHDLSEQVSVGNVGTSTTTVTITIGGTQVDSYSLAPSASKRVKYPNLNTGPVVVHSSGSVPIIASERVAYTPDAGATYTGYSELMGFPSNLLTDTYNFPWYNSVNLSSQISVGNVGLTTTTVTVTIGGSQVDSYQLAPNASKRIKYVGLNIGPVVVHSSGGVQIIATERVAYSPDGGTTWSNFSELMGLPNGQLTDTYMFPWYNSVNHSMQVSVANLGLSTTTITVTINGTQVDSYSLAPQASKRIKYTGKDTGPVVVQSSGKTPIIASERTSYTPNGGVTYPSFSEMLGLPGNLVTDTYLFPWYNNINLNTMLMFAVP